MKSCRSSQDGIGNCCIEWNELKAHGGKQSRVSFMHGTSVRWAHRRRMQSRHQRLGDWERGWYKWGKNNQVNSAQLSYDLGLSDLWLRETAAIVSTWDTYANMRKDLECLYLNGSCLFEERGKRDVNLTVYTRVKRAHGASHIGYFIFLQWVLKLRKYYASRQSTEAIKQSYLPIISMNHSNYQNTR